MVDRNTLWRSRFSYFSILAVGVIAERWSNYLWFEQPVLKGQAANILLTFAFFFVALIVWLLRPTTQRAGGWLLAFLISMSVAWVVHFFLYRIHGDSFNYTSFLYLPILCMIILKPPSAQEAWQAVMGFTWAVAIVLVATRLLEMLGLWTIRSQTEGVITFDTERYFLPFNDLLGIDGRWPGPFGHNGDTAMMGALIIVIAVAHWTRGSWFFIPVGLFTLLVTSGRASMGAVVAGLVILVMFTNRGRVTRIPRRTRAIIGVLVLAAGAFFMFSWKAGLTGRQNIWPAFLDLWSTSPWTGVGGSGIATSGGLTQEFGHAHSLYIDELARYGLVGFISQFSALAIGIIIACWAAGRGAPGPLGVLVAYFVFGITEPRNAWISPTATGFLVIMMVVTAAAELRRINNPRESAQPSGNAVIAPV